MKNIVNILEDSKNSPTYASNFSKILSYVKPWSLDQLDVIQKKLFVQTSNTNDKSNWEFA